MQIDKCTDIVPAPRFPKVIGSYLKSDADAIKTAKFMRVEFDANKLKEWLVCECIRRTGVDASIVQEAVEEKLAESDSADSDQTVEDKYDNEYYDDDDWVCDNDYEEEEQE